MQQINLSHLVQTQQFTVVILSLLIIGQLQLDIETYPLFSHKTEIFIGSGLIAF